LKYYSGDLIKEDDMGGSCSTHGRDEKCIRTLLCKPEYKRSLARSKDNIRMDGKVSVYWIYPAEGRV